MATLNGETIPNNMLTAEGVCDLLGWKMPTLGTYRWQRPGSNFPAPALSVGRVALWDAADVKRWRKTHGPKKAA